MVALTVAAEENHLVANVFALATCAVQVMNPVAKPLPLRFRTAGIVFGVGRILSIDESKVGLGLYQFTRQSLSRSPGYTAQAPASGVARRREEIQMREIRRCDVRNRSLSRW